MLLLLETLFLYIQKQNKKKNESFHMGTNLVNDGDVMIMHLNRLISEGIFLNFF